MKDKYQEAKNILNKYNQEYLLQFYNELSLESQRNLLDQITSIDFSLLKKIYDKSYIDDQEDLTKISPLPYIDINSINSNDKDTISELGLKSIKNNEYAVIIMAGGSGSRLGFDGPKGSFKFKLFGQEISFFELYINQLKSFNEKYHITIPCYIMTGKENSDETKLFFENNNYFNYPKSMIHFFIQDTLPILTKEGKCVLEEKNLILEGSNGNGNIFKSLKNNNIINQLQNNHIKWLFICGIDNILQNLIDPLFLGLTINNNKKLASKTLYKSDANAKSAVFCLKNNHPYILNYWDITDDITNKKDLKGNYLYRDTNIVNHLIHIDLCEQFANENLPYHRAYKKYSYIDASGNKIIPETPNTFKFEQFIFDAFIYADDMLLLRVNEKESFAPIKNKIGNDSIETAIKLYEEYYNDNN